MSNSGVFDVNDIRYLMDYQQWSTPGELQLIQTQTVSGVTQVDFTSIGDFNVHFLTVNDFQTSEDDRELRLRFGLGSTMRTASDYQQAVQFGNASGTFSEPRSTAIDRITLAGQIGNATNECANGYCYIYNALDSTKYTFVTSHITQNNITTVYNMQFVSYVYDKVNQNDTFRVYVSAGNIASATISLYGIRFS
jgi:hypothetical protein